MLDVEWKVSVWVSASYIPGRLLGALQMEMSPHIVAITYQVSTAHRINGRIIIYFYRY